MLFHELRIQQIEDRLAGLDRYARAGDGRRGGHAAEAPDETPNASASGSATAHTVRPARMSFISLAALQPENSLFNPAKNEAITKIPPKKTYPSTIRFKSRYSNRNNKQSVLF